MNEGVLDPTAADQKGARHLKAVASEWPDSVAIEECGAKAPRPGGNSEELPEPASVQTQGAVETGLGIGDARQVGQSITVEQCRGLLLGAEVHEHRLHSLGLDRPALGCEIRESLATERAAEMPEEDNQKGGRL
jgi:hypothetical protein